MAVTETVTSLSEPVTALDQRPPIGALARLSGQVFVVGALLALFGAVPSRPAVATMLLLPALGCALLAPRWMLMRARLSLPLLMMVGWLALSWVWSETPTDTMFLIRTQVPLFVAGMVVAGVLPVRAVTNAIVTTVRLVVVVVTVALVVDPATRTGSVDGWHGTFDHKNHMAAFLVFGLATVLVLDRRRTTRWLTVAGIGVLLAGSLSATGVSGALLVMAGWGWSRLLVRARPVDVLPAFVTASLAAAALAGIAVAANVSSILGVYDKSVDLTGRTPIWSAVLGAIRERPFTGYGWGGILRIERPSPRTLEIWREVGYPVPHPHSGVLDVVVQLGWIGLALYVVVIGLTVVLAVSVARRRADLATWVLLVLAAMVVMSISENVLLGPWLLVVIVIRSVLLAAGPRITDRYPSPAEPDREPGVALTVAEPPRPG